MIARTSNLRPAIGAAALVTILFTAGAFAQGDYEPNDTPASAQPLNFPFMFTSGTISTNNDIDYYTFEGTIGHEVTIWLEAPTFGSDLRPVLALYDANGRLLAYNEAEYHLALGQFSDDPILYLKLPTTSAYYVAVTSFANFHNKDRLQPGTTGPYNLRLFSNFDSKAVGDRYEPNDTRQAAFPASLPLRTYGSSLMYFGDIDWYSFTAAKGDRISVDVDALEMTATVGAPLLVQARVGVFDESGRLLQSSTTAPDPDTGFPGDPFLVLNVTKSGKYYVAVTFAPDESFATPFRSAAFLADPKVSGAAHSIGYYQLRIRSVQDLYFPHIASGTFGEASFATSFLLVNTTSEEANGHVSLFRPDGTPLVTGFALGGEPGSAVYFVIPAKGGIRISTDGLGEGVTGYAVVSSVVGVGGSLVFSQRDSTGALVTEAGVGASAGMDFFAFPVEVGGEVNTGVAIANISGLAKASLYLRLVDTGGRTVQSRSLTLNPGEHVSVFVAGLGQLFPTITDFRGSLQATSDVPVHPIALRTSRSSLTTLPASKLNQSFQPATLHFPHVVAGGSASPYRTTLILTNSGYFSVSGSVQYTRSDGSPMRLVTGAIEASTVDFTIPPQGTVFLESRGSSDLQQGFATLRANHGVGGVLILSQADGSGGGRLAEVGIAPAESATSFFVFAESEDGYTTGLAVANVGIATTNLLYHLQPGDGGDSLEQGPLPLAAGEHFAGLVAGPNQLFPSFSGRGALEVSSTTPVPAVALRVGSGTMTSLPVVRVR